jgi:hypothetical protein
MTNLGPGVQADYNPTVTPQWVFTPTPGTQASVRLFNEGNVNPVYVGGPGVTQYTGLPILPGNRPIELQNINQQLYAVSGVTAPIVRGTVGASAATAGTTALTLTAAVPAGLAAGTYVLIGNTANTSGMQAQLVASTTASSQITFANPLVLDVANGDVVYSATFQPGQLRVNAGVG